MINLRKMKVSIDKQPYTNISLVMNDTLTIVNFWLVFLLT